MPVKRRRRAAWIGSRGGDADCLGEQVELRGVVCCDWSRELADLAHGVPVASLERAGAERLAWVSSDLERHTPETIRALLVQAAGPRGADLLAVCYSAQAVVEAAFAGGVPGVALVAPPAKAVRRLADKRTQRALFRALGIRSPEARVVSAAELRDGAARSSGLPAVVQPAHGTRGMGVHVADRPDDLTRLAARWPEETPLLVSPRIDGPSLNVNAVVGRDDLRVAWPSLQVLAPAGCCDADWPFAYCGNDYAAAADLPQRAHDALCDTLERLAPALRREGFLGLFGADAIWDGNALWLLELNLRFQGSTALLARIERAAGLPSLVAAHLETFAPGTFSPAELPPARPARPLCGAQVLLYQPEPAPVTLRAAPDPGALPGAPEYTWRESPPAGTRVHPRAPLGRLVTEARALDRSLLALDAGARAAVSEVRARLAWD
jgi:hypothetical protein